MKNREKFAKEILNIACNGRIMAVTKDNEVVCCDNINCESCMFESLVGRSQACSDQLREWSESEYVEKLTITSREKNFLGSLLSNFKYIARDSNDALYIYYNKPKRNSMDNWIVDDNNYYYVSREMNVEDDDLMAENIEDAKIQIEKKLIEFWKDEIAAVEDKIEKFKEGKI